MDSKFETNEERFSKVHLSYKDIDLYFKDKINVKLLSITIDNRNLDSARKVVNTSDWGGKIPTDQDILRYIILAEKIINDKNNENKL